MFYVFFNVSRSLAQERNEWRPPKTETEMCTESGLELPGLDLASLATQGSCAGAQPAACTGYGIFLEEPSQLG